MDENHPTNSEILITLTQLRERQEEFQVSNNESHQAIIRRLDIANGRTSVLERWQSFMMGGLAILSVLVVPLVFKIVFQ